MKKLLFNLPIIALAGLVFLGSCGPKKNEDPSSIRIRTVDGGNVYEANESFNVNIFMVASTAKSFAMIYDGVKQSVQAVTVFPTGDSVSTNVSVSFSNAGIRKIAFTLYSDEAGTKVIATSSELEVLIVGENTFSLKELGDQAHPSLGSYLNLRTGDVISSANATAATVDLNFVSLPTPVTATSQASFISPNLRGSKGFTTNTNLNRVTKIGTTNLAYTSSVKAIQLATSPTANEVVNVTVNSVYLFETQDGTKGLLQVTAIQGTAGGTDRRITVNIKVASRTGVFANLQ